MCPERCRHRGHVKAQTGCISTAKQLLGRLPRLTHPGIYVTDKRCVVNTHAVFKSHQVRFRHGRVCSIGIQADIFADVCSQESKVPHLVQETKLGCSFDCTSGQELSMNSRCANSAVMLGSTSTAELLNGAYALGMHNNATQGVCMSHRITCHELWPSHSPSTCCLPERPGCREGLGP